MPFFPIALDLKGRLCVVVGGGRVASRKVHDLLAAGANVRLVSPELDPYLTGQRDSGLIEVVEEVFSPETLDGAHLLFVATNDEVVNRTAFDAARKAGILVNVADVPPLCDFHVPAVVRRGDFLIALSTGGKSPGFSRRIRKRLSEEYGEEYGQFLELMGEIRSQVAELPNLDQKARQEIYEKILDSKAFALVEKGEMKKAMKLARKIAGLK